MIEIGLLVVATGKYIQFVDPLWKSTKRYFLKQRNIRVTMFVFTDSDTVPAGTKRLFWEHRAFPFATLLRYHVFTKYQKTLKKMDYLFYCDADMEFVSLVGEEILGKRVATLHPGFYTKARKDFTYENNSKSTAYISPDQGKAYYCGGFNGGEVKEFLNIARILKRNIDKDLKNGIIASHNDESHYNWYLAKHLPTLVLSPSYCYPEDLLPAVRAKDLKSGINKLIWFPKQLLELKPKLIARSKDHSKIRYTGIRLLIETLIQSKEVLFLKGFTILNRVRVEWVRLKWHYLRLKEQSYRNYLLQPPIKVIQVSQNSAANRMLLVTVAFNCVWTIEAQIDALKKNLQDPFTHIIIDNSSDSARRSEIEQVARTKGVGYISLPKTPSHISPSMSHGLALNYACNWTSKHLAKYVVIGFLDHDIYPFKSTNLFPIMKKQPFYGLLQNREEKWYLWPGFMFFNRDFSNSKQINFLPQNGLDTGGRNWESIYRHIEKSSIEFPQQFYVSLSDYKKLRNINAFPKIPISKKNQLVKKDQLIEIIDSWVHVFNASNWRKANDKEKEVKEFLLWLNKHS